MASFVTFLIGLLGGVAVGFQTPTSNAIGQRVGGISSSLIVHLSGAIFSAFFLILRGGENIRNFKNLPAWMFLSGLFGVVVITSISYTVPRIGAAAAISLIIIGQLVTGLIVDHFGLLEAAQRSIDGYRILAVVFLIIGGYLMAR